MIWRWVVLGALVAMRAPQQLQVATRGGTATIALWDAPGNGPMVPLPSLAKAVGGKVTASAERITLTVTGGTFSFLVGTMLVSEKSGVHLLPAAVRLRHDSVFVPLAFVVEVLADPARKAWKWTAASGTLSEFSLAIPPARTPATTPVTTARGPVAAPPKAASAGATATEAAPPRTTPATPVLKRRHLVTIDPGHGGPDGGNPGTAFPRNVHEKDVNLTVGLQLRDELIRRGVDVKMTRTTDTLINLVHRAPRYCGRDCDLFVSLHVNSLKKAPGYTATRGFETFFLDVALTADAMRVAKMENDAVRYEAPEAEAKDAGGLDFMLKDLQDNAFLRSSASAAAMMQQALRAVHDGTNRGVKQANLAVLRTARSPAILVEMGFGTNASDARLMTTAAGQRKLVDGIADGIMAFLKNYDAVTQAGSSP